MCLSPRVARDRSQKLINPFVFETKESACICFCIDIMAVVYNTQSKNIIEYNEHPEIEIEKKYGTIKLPLC